MQIPDAENAENRGRHGGRRQRSPARDACTGPRATTLPGTAENPLAYRARRLVAIPNTPGSPTSNCRKSTDSHFRSVQTSGAAEAAALAEAAAAPGAPFVASRAFPRLRGCGSGFRRRSR